MDQILIKQGSKGLFVFHGAFGTVPQPGAGVPADILAGVVRPSVDYLRHKRFRSGNYPSSLSNESDRLVHWCHGAPGVVPMLLMAYQVRGDGTDTSGGARSSSQD